MSNKNVLITGADGFIGRNLQSQLRLEAETYNVQAYTLSSTEKLEDLLGEADFVFHLAGVNRPKDESEFQTGNTDLTRRVTEGLAKTGRATPILITSSIQAVQDNPYGRSKLAAEQLVVEYGDKTGADAFIMRLPNVFGKWSQPNYNSAVATFCHNLTHDLPITVNDPAAALRLVYIDDVVRLMMRCLDGTQSPDEVSGTLEQYTIPTTVGAVATKLQELVAMRGTLIVPDVSDRLTKYLYATLTSFYDTDDLTYDLTVNSDDRGWLFELAKSHQFGQVFISQTKPGYTRGDHWHKTKVEKFCVIQGSGEVSFRLPDTNEIFSYKLDGSKVQVIDIPVGYIHAIQNTGDVDMLLVIWASEILDKENPDTFWEKVKEES